MVEQGLEFIIQQIPTAATDIVRRTDMSRPLRQMLYQELSYLDRISAFDAIVSAWALPPRFCVDPSRMVMAGEEIAIALSEIRK